MAGVRAVRAQHAARRPLGDHSQHHAARQTRRPWPVAAARRLACMENDENQITTRARWRCPASPISAAFGAQQKRFGIVRLVDLAVVLRVSTMRGDFLSISLCESWEISHRYEGDETTTFLWIATRA